MGKAFRTFTCEDFFRKDERVHIHISDEFPEFVGVLHSHSFIEIVYIISGAATHIVGNNKYSVKKGDLIVINYKEPHMFKAKSGEEFSAFDLMFTPDFFDASAINANKFEKLTSTFLFYSFFPNERPLGSDFHLSGTGYIEFGELFERIYKEYTLSQKGYIDIIRAYVVELVIKIFRRIDDDPDSTLTLGRLDIVNTAVNYLKNNFNAPVNIDNLATKVFLSKDYFSRLFKNATGMSVSTFWQKTRIEQACNLLATTNRAISDIANSCGYNDIKFFYTSFKQFTGITPRQYRDMSAGNQSSNSSCGK